MDLAAAIGSNGGGIVLSSNWDGLNPALLAKFYPLKRDDSGGGWSQAGGSRQLAPNYTVDDGYEVHCPITDGQMEMSLNWISPFEGAGAESKAPTLSSMLQSDALTPALQAFLDKSGGKDKSGVADKALSTLAQAAGRTGITKLNSTQVFQGMPPIKFNVTAHFRALSDPIAEVREPISQLEEWAVPQLLATDSVLTNAVKNGADQSAVETIYPSIAPQIIGMRYGDGTYLPLVIESVSKPITNPRNQAGVMISCSVQLSLATLSAWDRRDIQRLYR
jgi:hypothetical protein